MKPGMKVNPVKEPENEYDNEAIAVTLPGLNLVGSLQILFILCRTIVRVQDACMIILERK